MTEPLIHSVFPSLIYYKKLSDFDDVNSALAVKAVELKNQHRVKTNWLCGTFNSMGIVDLRDDPVFRLLINRTQECVKEFGHQYGLVHLEPECIDAWVNVADPGDYQEYHNHPRSHFSAVYYIKASDNSGDIHFKNADSFFDSFPLPIIPEFENINSTQTIKIAPEESLLLIFRSNLNHMVNQNMSKNFRISMAMNFSYTNG